MMRMTLPQFGALVLALGCGPLTAQHTNHPLGIDPNLKYQRAGNIDQVALFSGTLTARIPLGPFNLLYNSNVWRYYGETNSDGSPANAARVDREMTAGLGWHLGWGEVYSSEHWYNDNEDGDWLYVDDMGVHHVFHDRNLHEGEPENGPSYMYTRDGSYLRLHRVDNTHVTIEFPNGSLRLFDSGTGGLATTYHLHKIWNPISAQMDPLPTPDFVIEYDRHPDPGNNQIKDEAWRTVTDRFGRVTNITLSNQYSDINRVVTQIDIPATAGQTETYKFTYRQKPLTVSCKDTWDGSPTTRSVPFLIDIELPDGSHYNMDAGNGEVRYFRHPGCSIEDLGGVISGIQLPTGGQIEWTFQEYEFPPGDSESPFNTSAGVKTRQLLDHDGNQVGNPWHWRVSSSEGLGPETFDRDFYNECVYPDGRCVKNYFNAIYIRDAQPDPENLRPELFPRGWERGLPFVYHTSVGSGNEEKFLSTELFSGHNATTKQCSGNVVQTTYARYRRDVLPGISPESPDSEWYRANQAVEGTRVVYNLDGNNYVDTAHTDFTGVGGFRTTTTKGNLWPDSTNNELRTVQGNYDSDRGTYPNSYNPVGIEEPWLFGLSDWMLHSEPEATGVTTTKTETQFESDGFLKCSRVLANGASRGDHDVVTVYERDSNDPNGLINHVKTFGGDLQILPTDGSVCGIDPDSANPEFWISHDYERATLVTSWQVDPSDPDASPLFLTYDIDIDPQSDEVIASRDSNGLETTMTYDSSGRLVVSTPEEGASTHRVFQRFSADPPLPAKITTTLKSGMTVLGESYIELDDFGRQVIEGRKLPDGVDSKRESTWDVQGRTLTVSEWGNFSKKTIYDEFDPWGRPQKVTPPDGAGHNLDFSYQGRREITKTVRRALGTGSETAVNVVEEYDSHGRLRKVREPSGNDYALTPKIVINEVDANSNTGEDFADFIELYGPPNQSLNDYVLVLFNGNGNTSYRAFNLDGYQTDSNGFFVLGDTDTPNVNYGAWHGNTLQDGPDAVALYIDDASSFPNGTPVTNHRLIDALVYDTNDHDDFGLLNVLTPGQTQHNEDGGTQGSTEFSNARVPNGGTSYSKPGNTAWYRQQYPTPGLPNDPVAETPTTFAFDVQGRLTQIQSGLDPFVQTRNINYDARGFLLSEFFPESGGARTYSQYNALGNMTRSHDGEHDLEYHYDYLNRLEKVLDVGQGRRPVTENTYDTAPGNGLGKLHSSKQHNYIVNVQNLPWSATPGEDVEVTQSFSYLGLGGAESQRNTHLEWSSGEVAFQQDVTYTPLGNLDTYTYPRCVSPSPQACRNSDAGDNGPPVKTIDYNYANGSLIAIADVGGGFNWASWTYHNSGTWHSLSHGNGVTENLTLDPNLRNRVRKVSTTGVIGGPNLDTGILNYDGAGNLKAAGVTTYTYDKVGRLASSKNTSGTDQDFFYDRFGNMTVEDLDFTIETIDPLTNRFLNGSYDLAGNLLYYDPGFGGWNWFYNENNKVTAQNWLNYVYDSFGERIASYTVGGAKYHIRDASGQRRSTFQSIPQGGADDTWERGSDFILSGRRILGSTNPRGRFHFHLDQLGNTRIVTNENGVETYDYHYAPYGFEYNTGYGGTTDEYFTTLFTGHERDFSTGSDYMHARHYNSQIGRFTSPDLLRGTPSQPQTLNRYAYVAGNPLNATDPSGLNPEYLEQQSYGVNPWLAMGFVDIFNRFDLGLTFISIADKHRAALAANQQHQDFKPGWLTGALGGNWGFKPSGNSSDEDSSSGGVLLTQIQYPIGSNEDNNWVWPFIAGTAALGRDAIQAVLGLPKETTLGPPKNWQGLTTMTRSEIRLHWLGRTNLFISALSLGISTGTLIRQIPGVDEWVQDWESEIILNFVLTQDKTRANSPFKGAL